MYNSNEHFNSAFESVENPIMKDQRKGAGTKEKILVAACRIFVEKGYRDATHAEICRQAETNIAAINYYFSSKENLYRTVFERLARKLDDIYPLDGGLKSSAPPEQRLHAFIHAHLSRMFDPEHLGDLHRIRMSEMFDPTGLLEDLLEQRLAHDRQYIQTVLREILGTKAKQRDIDWCELSIVGQCFMAAPGPMGKGPGPRDIFLLKPGKVGLLADHILSFSLAGIAAISRKMEPVSSSKKQTERKKQ